MAWTWREYAPVSVSGDLWESVIRSLPRSRDGGIIRLTCMLRGWCQELPASANLSARDDMTSKHGSAGAACMHRACRFPLLGSVSMAMRSGSERAPCHCALSQGPGTCARTGRAGSPAGRRCCRDRNHRTCSRRRHPWFGLRSIASCVSGRCCPPRYRR